MKKKDISFGVTYCYCYCYYYYNYYNSDYIFWFVWERYIAVFSSGHVWKSFAFESPSWLSFGFRSLNCAVSWE